MDISLTDLEEAINFWRRQRPATGEECALSPEVNALAELYARMIFEGIVAMPLEALAAAQHELISSWQLQRQQA